MTYPRSPSLPFPLNQFVSPPSEPLSQERAAPERPSYLSTLFSMRPLVPCKRVPHFEEEVPEAVDHTNEDDYVNFSVYLKRCGNPELYGVTGKQARDMDVEGLRALFIPRVVSLGKRFTISKKVCQHVTIASSSA